MPRFWYEALSATGEKITNEGDFTSIQDLYFKLKNQGLTLINYKKKASFSLPGLSKKIKRTELAELCRNLSLVVKGGIPLVDALRDICDSPGISSLRRVLSKIITRVEGGELLSDALLKYKKYFPNILIVLVQLGEETGHLDKTLADAADHLEKIQEIIDKTKKAISYPAVILGAMFGALAFWILYVLPKLFELFNTLGLKELPWATKVLLSTVEISKTYWPIIPLIILSLVTFGVLASKNEKIKLIWDNIWIRFPIIGSIIKASQQAFFFEYLSLLTASGIDVLRSLEIMEGAINHLILKQAIKEIKTTISSGGNLSDGFKKCTLFEPFVLRMVRVGEASGNMPEQLKILAAHYMSIVNRLVDSIASKIEPILIFFAGLIFVIIAMGLLGPIYDMMGTVK